ANLWATLQGNRRAVSELESIAAKRQEAPLSRTEDLKAATMPTADQARQAFADALYAVLGDRGGQSEWDASRDHLLARYNQAAREKGDLRLPDGDVKGRMAVGAVVVL